MFIKEKTEHRSSLLFLNLEIEQLQEEGAILERNLLIMEELENTVRSPQEQEELNAELRANIEMLALLNEDE